jgi:ABC-type nickel/cobalt efflux system permease component RcnA
MENNPKKSSAAISLVLVFLLPLAVFAGVAITCKSLLQKYISHQDLRTAVSFLIAAAATIGFLYAVRAINLRSMKGK